MQICTEISKAFKFFSHGTLPQRANLWAEFAHVPASSGAQTPHEDRMARHLSMCWPG